MKQNKHRMVAFLLALLLIWGIVAPAMAVEASQEIHIRTAQELIAFSKNCSVDRWSVGKTVYLDADIDLSGTDFQPIPIFAGTFDGQGHTISGFSITGSGDDRGFFRYVQAGGIVQRLNVSGTITPSDRKDSIGGLVGVNSGKLLNCSFDGAVKGGTNVGGVAGYNMPTGQLINCTYSGVLLGEHYVGGIVGQNEGSVIRCQNEGDINITEVKTTVAIHEVDLSTIRSTENAPACTDIGGIAGASSGILQSCTNNGDVGYEHVGYNVGGIAGRQSGWLDSCVNNGTIRGRKDVGGICGQMEPRLTLLFDQDSLDELWDELDTLQALMDQAISDAEGVSNDISARLTGITDSADEVKNAASDLSDALTDWADENIETVNDVSARISWTMDRLEPIADSVDAALGRIQNSADLAGDALDELDEMGDYAQDALDDLRHALDRVSSAAQQASNAVKQLRSALQGVQDALGDSGAMSDAVNEVKHALDGLITAFGGMSEAFQDLWCAVGELKDQGGESAKDSSNSEAGEVASSAQEGGEPEAGGNTSAEGDSAADEEGSAEIELPGWDYDDMDWDGVLDALEEMRSAAIHIQNAFTSLKQAVGGVGNTAEEIVQDTLDNIAAAAATLNSGFHMLGTAAEHIEDAVESLHDATPYGESASQLMKEAAETLEDACDQLRQAGDTFRDVMSELADKPEISFRPVADAVDQKGDVLDDTVGGLSDAMQALNDTMSTSSDLLLEDMRAINRQFGKVIDVLRRHTDSEEEDEDEELLEDVSDQATETDEDAGRITNAKNLGSVEGDVNVAGIVGSMAIEYDYDPEDDLTTAGDRSLDFHYQAAALTERCVNSGTVTGKKDYVGGIVGRMDLGTVSQCESYAPVESTDGDYVGGIAGAAWSTVRSCWSCCALAGNDYIGGVAGLGKTVMDCRSLVEIDEGSAYLGAVLGCEEEDGAVSGNLFTHTTLSGISGISYVGKAEPVDFETLSQDAPAAFTQFHLVFQVEGQEVASYDFSYGDALLELPKIPGKEGYSASWPDKDYSFLTFSRTLDAEYTPYTTALTALGDPPKIVVEGTFHSGSSLSANCTEEVWTDSSGAAHTGSAYTVAVTDPEGEVSSFQVQYKLSDDCKNCSVWVKTGEVWSKQEAEIDGSYVVFEAEGDVVTFVVREDSWNLLVMILAGLLCVAIAGGVIAVQIKKRHRGKEKEC